MKRIVLISTPGRGLPSLPAAVALLFLPGCATLPATSAESAIQSAMQAIGNAEQARAARTAGTELNEARDKLASAQTALRGKQRVRAERFAQEARVDAELALARNEVAMARRVKAGPQRNHREIERKMQRNQGVRK